MSGSEADKPPTDKPSGLLSSNHAATVPAAEIADSSEASDIEKLQRDANHPLTDELNNKVDHLKIAECREDKSVHTSDSKPMEAHEKDQNSLGMKDEEHDTSEDDEDSDDDTSIYYAEAELRKLRNVKLPSIPSLKRVVWDEFKNKSSTEAEERQHAIEVLIGPSRYHDTYKSDVYKWRKERSAGIIVVGQQPEEKVSKFKDAGPEESTILDIHEVPERIRIISMSILAILADIRKEEPTKIPTVFLRPYRPLLRAQCEIRNHLKTLEEKWGQEAEASGEDGTIQSNPEAMNSAQTNSQKHSHSNPSPPSTTAFTNELDETLTSNVESVNSERAAPISTDEVTDSVQALKDLRCLVEFLDLYVLPTVRSVEDHSKLTIKFQDLHYLFKPGMDIDASNGVKRDLKEDKDNQKKKQGALRFQDHEYQTRWRVLETLGGRSALRECTSTDKDFQNADKAPIKGNKFPFWVSCYNVDYDGLNFDCSWHTFDIKPFDGERNITDLEVFPLAYLKSHESATAKLLARGKRFLELVRHSHRHMRYKGLMYSVHPCGCGWGTNEDTIIDMSRTFTGEVIVDFAEAYRIHPHFSVCDGDVQRLLSWKAECSKTSKTPKNVPFSDLIFNDNTDGMELLEGYKKKIDFFQSVKRLDHDENIPELDDQHLVLLPSRVFGFVLKERIFAGMDIDNLSPAVKDDHIFDSLELPQHHKSMVQSLVRQHINSKGNVDGRPRELQDWDVIEGKGRGLIMLLHGVPGVGKTSTAECVARANGLLLYPITCGDLGLTPDKVEQSLKEKFYVASLWNCVLLLDEADIFLTQRDRTDIQRNAMVSVFLRVLEYYDGILFLTTNRVGVFDEAFKSRIHVSLYYPALTRDQTINIFWKNLKRARTVDQARVGRTNASPMEIEDDLIINFAERHFMQSNNGYGRWNGRQIRNAFQTATALALYEATQPDQVPKLKVRHFETVANVTIDFGKYIRETRGRSDDVLAHERMERSDHWQAPQRPMEQMVASSYSSHDSVIHQSVSGPPMPHQYQTRYGESPNYRGHQNQYESPYNDPYTATSAYQMMPSRDYQYKNSPRTVPEYGQSQYGQPQYGTPHSTQFGTPQGLSHGPPQGSSPIPSFDPSTPRKQITEHHYEQGRPRDVYLSSSMAPFAPVTPGLPKIMNDECDIFLM